jgi:outer membrane immunogenic protein
MKKEQLPMKKYAIPLAVTLVAPLAFADTTGYSGLSVSRIQFEYFDEGIDLRPDVVLFRAGAEFNDYIGIEGRVGTGISRDDVQAANVNTSLQPDWLYGGHLKLSAPVNEGRGKPYLMAGKMYTHSTLITRTDTGLGTVRQQRTRRTDGLSLGGGVDILLNSSTALNIEYMRYADNRDEKLRAVSLGIRTGF